MFDSDTRTVGELEEQIGAFEDPPVETVDDDERARLVDALVALADAYGSRGEFDEEETMLERLDRLHQEHPDADVDIHLAIARANATAVHDRDGVYETGIDPGRIESHREEIETLYAERPEPTIAAPLARATAGTIHAYGKAEEPERIEPLLDRLEALYENHEETDVAAAVMRGYAHAERYLGGDDTDFLSRAETLYSSHPDGDVAVGLAGVLAGRTNTDAAQEDVESIERRIARIETLAQQYPAVEAEIVRWLPIAAANVTRISFELADYGRIEHWAGKTNEYHERLDTPTSATWAAVATFYSARASLYDAEVEAGEEKLERLRALEAEYDNPIFEHWLGRCLFDAVRANVETARAERAQELADELAEYAVGHQDQEQIEAGLDTLRSQAPTIFGDEEPTLGDDLDDPVKTSATGGSVSDPATNGGSTGDGPELSRLDERATVEGSQELSEAIDLLDDGGHEGGSCSSGGCESCNSEQDLAEPASGPAIVAGVVVAATVFLSVAYAGYRLVKLGASAVRNS
ncbi:hypothetical protein ACFQL3_16300 [Natronoarchaeum sp. GCM10025321]|uniref:hypothetical protein n=1 Tax=Natronoarchaeum sp. GCM10025321 TaxID=3252684 RepID=UPI00360E1BC6